MEAPAAENGTVDDGVRSVASNPVTSPGTDQASARAAAPSVRHKVGDATQGKTYDSEEAFRASDLVSLRRRCEHKISMLTDSPSIETPRVMWHVNPL